MGHESIDITYRYSHLFPSKQVAMADKLDEVNAEFEDDMDGADNESAVVAESSKVIAGVAAEDMEESAEMIDLDAVDCSNKKPSNVNGKIVSIGKYRAV